MKWLESPQATSSLGTAVGTIGLALWFTRLLVQTIKNVRRREVLETDRHQWWALMCWLAWGFFSQLPAGINAITFKMPAYVTCFTHVNMAFVIVLFFQSLMYLPTYLNKKLVVLSAAFVLALVFTLAEWTFLTRIERGICAHTSDGRCGTLFSRIAVICMPLFWVPLLVESWRHQGRAVSLGPMPLALGLLGGFELMSMLMLRGPYETEVLIPYFMITMFESALYLSHTIWRFRTRHVRREAKEMGLTFDELLAQYAKHGVSFRWVHSRKWTKEQEATRGRNTRWCWLDGVAVANRQRPTVSGNDNAYRNSRGSTSSGDSVYDGVFVPSSVASRLRSPQRATVRHVEYAYGRDSI